MVLPRLARVTVTGAGPLVAGHGAIPGRIRGLPRARLTPLAIGVIARTKYDARPVTISWCWRAARKPSALAGFIPATVL